MFTFFVVNVAHGVRKAKRTYQSEDVEWQIERLPFFDECHYYYVEE